MKDILPENDDVRVQGIEELVIPDKVLQETPSTTAAGQLVFDTRQQIHCILHGVDDRLLVIVGPCSIHDPKAALEYAQGLIPLIQHWKQELLLVMRVYFEKPRTTVGWKGLINDPALDGSFKINEGLRVARRLLLTINEMGVPAGTEFLDLITPQYLADLISWGAIGARTTESQVHRELASGLSCPVGFKNGTDGNLRIAVDAIRAAQQPHHFLSVTKAGRSAIVATRGNEDCHVILRGGKLPNYQAHHVEEAASQLAQEGLSARIMIDLSHANSAKNPENQVQVGHDVALQLRQGEQRIMGVMIESHLRAGRQDLIPGKPLTYGQSITDGCLAMPQTAHILEELGMAVRARRARENEEE
ncbi:phospho-2-dehydro-3-deoxyheptonate aldolase, Phe-sensitive [Ferrovum myxofaciens]|uniref:Phospho-2-dehydro-3-deoxyheptonate aldolase n=1 Tax=Ferrovum myxofaciens TaxID=416213 RepID=A0A149VXK6_9PROT|nr:3-deoxy-7-phosphoheptulonate synthase [Ferrovum myxofaciens]KXW57942.1 phospho-2-dehydro-3-deoxyheptonate aldolase, Phe-sensitive [Ferrovum myxofaciens]